MLRHIYRTKNDAVEWLLQRIGVSFVLRFNYRDDRVADSLA